MANIPIRDIPGAVVASPDPSNLIPMDNGSLMQKTTIANAVNTALPMASQSEAEAGVDNAKRMSPLRTKQAIDAQTPAIVNVAITALNLDTMSQEDASDYTPTAGLAAVALSNDYGDLSNLPTLGTAAATAATDYATAAQGSLADTAVQPGNAALVPSGGTIGQVLVKNSGTNYDTGWVSSAAATAVSYAPQSLSSSEQAQARSNISAALRGHIHGLTLANNTTDATNDIDFGDGECASDEAEPILMVHTAGTAQLDAAFGTGNGGRFDSSVSDGTWHCFVISDGTTVARGFSKSLDPTGEANYPSGYTHYRRVGSIIRVSNTFVTFTQTGRRFDLLFPPASYNTTPSASSTLVALRVPTGIQVSALFQASIASAIASSLTVVFQNHGEYDAAPSVTDTPGVDLVASSITGTVNRAAGEFERVTNTSGQVRYRASAASGNLLIVTRGWIDDAAPD